MGKHFHIEADSGHDAMLAIMVHLNREDMGQAIDLLIDRLDALTGDPELEENGDERDGSIGEDDFCNHNLSYAGPGCPVSDGNSSTGCGAGDPAWAEWHTRGRRKIDDTGAEQCRTLNMIGMAHEDVEIDDHIEANGDEYDGVNAEDELLTDNAKMRARQGGGCALSDGLEPFLGAPEACAGRWQGIGMGSNTDDEPWFVPATMNALFVANDGVSE